MVEFRTYYPKIWHLDLLKILKEKKKKERKKENLKRIWEIGKAGKEHSDLPPLILPPWKQKTDLQMKVSSLY